MNVSKMENFVRFFNIEEIDRIDQTSNQFLFPYFRIFKNLVEEKFSSGTFFIDPMGIYVVLKESHNEIIHLERLPFETRSIYAITDFQNPAVFRYEDYLIFFIGVINIPEIGFKFIKDDYIIRPVLDVVFFESSRDVVRK
jgi:hypothetical protein